MKVHFAAFENLTSAITLTKLAGIRYGLFSCFSYLAKKHGIQASAKGDPAALIQYLEKALRHTIMDSGLFTLMFGAHAGKRDKRFMESWQQSIIEFVRTNSYKGAVVEVDCQKVLGVDEAWTLRKELRNALSNELINVYHAEDGNHGLDRLIEFSDYIAISVPELRAMYVPQLAEYVKRQAAYIKNKKPDIRIHLLGCTEVRIMRQCTFCDSCDSTSWQQVNRYGNLEVIYDDRTVKITRSRAEQLTSGLDDDVKQALAEEGVSVKSPTGHTYLSSFVIAGLHLKLHYSKYAGEQS